MVMLGIDLVLGIDLGLGLSLVFGFGPFGCRSGLGSIIFVTNEFLTGFLYARYSLQIILGILWDE